MDLCDREDGFGWDQVVNWFGTKVVGDIIMGAYGVVLYYNCEQEGDGRPASALGPGSED